MLNIPVLMGLSMDIESIAILLFSLKISFSVDSLELKTALRRTKPKELRFMVAQCGLCIFRKSENTQ